MAGVKSEAQYSSLCAMCEDPAKCDYPDKYSGYEGALRCLAQNGGDVAFTKVIYTRKFFGLPVGTIPAGQAEANPDDYAYLCADGTKVPIREKACSWAARPWQGLLGHNDVLAKLSPLREKIKQLAAAGKTAKPTWFTKVLGLSEKINHVADNIAIQPDNYLKKAHYDEVIERGHGAPEPIVRLCVTSGVALAKCRAMSTFAFSRDIRPRLDCIQEASEDACLQNVQNNGADLASVDDMKVASASKKYNLHPVFHEVYGDKKTPKYAVAVVKKGTTYNNIGDLRGKRRHKRFNLHPVFHEVYGDKKTPNYAVAVVKKGTTYNNIGDLRGKRSCHNPFGTFSGLQAPLFYLINKKLINSDHCIKNMADFFSGGACLPGVDKLENNPTGADVANLKKQCSSDNDNNPMKCLQENRGDVAFVSSADLSNYDSTQFELLCLNKDAGGRDALANFETCNIMVAPSRTWLAARDFMSDVSIAHTPLSLAALLDDKTDLFNIYGEFLKNNNVIFNNAAKGLATTEKFDFDKFKTVHDVISTCGVA